MSRVIALIPARGGSVRIPRKNLRPFHGQPIMQYSIDTAKATGLFDEVWVSTDDAEIERLAHRNACKVYRRPQDDGARGTQEVAREVLMELPEVMACCVIYPTAPLIVPADIHRCWAVLQRKDMLFSMTVQTDPLADAGAVYFGWAHPFRFRAPLVAEHTVMVPMPNSRVCDINTEDDWRRAESLYAAWRGTNGK